MEAVNAGLINLTFTLFTVIVIPSIILFIKLYFPCGSGKLCSPGEAGPLPPNSHVSTVIFTSSSAFKDLN